MADLAPDEESVQGFLPQEIAKQIRAYPLDLSLVTASLRGYQAFGAKFALVQERVIIGDEMGLGKTVQALAAMAHLAGRRRDALPGRLPGQRRRQLDARDREAHQTHCVPLARARA